MVQPGGHILLVDDDGSALDLHEEALTNAGFQVETACDGISALRACRMRKPQVVVLDLLMPGMDGGEVLQQLRNDERTRAVPVIALTGVPEWLQDHRHAVAEFNDILLKPVPCDLLIQTIWRVLEPEI
jgi:CheY-like chemotaxis protein